MKTFIALVIATLLAGQTPSFAQEPATPQAPAEAAASTTAPSPSDTSTSPPEAAESALAKQWREEVLSWKDPHRIEEGTTTGSITEISRRVLVLGTVDGSVNAISGDVAILGEVNGDVAAVSGDVTILGKVNGKVSAVSGKVRVAGEVTGNTSVVSGKIETAPGARLAGDSGSTRTSKWKLNYNAPSSTVDFSFDGQAGPIDFIRSFWFSSFMTMIRSGLLILWIAVGCAVAAIFQPAILRTQADLRQAPGRNLALGFLWVIAYWMLLAGCIVLSFMLIGIPLVIILVAFDLALRVFGMTVVFAVFGDWLARRINRPNVSIFAAVFVGACALGLLRLVPILGSFVWFAAGLFGIGATLATRFGSPSSGPSQIPPLPTGAAA